MQQSSQVATISVSELKRRLDAGEALTLIDVREPAEREIAQIGGIVIPMAQVAERLSEIPKQGAVVVYCRSGGRSGMVCQQLQQHFQYANLLNLKGGVLAWADEIDPTMQKY